MSTAEILIVAGTGAVAGLLIMGAAWLGARPRSGPGRRRR